MSAASKKRKNAGGVPVGSESELAISCSCVLDKLHLCSCVVAVAYKSWVAELSEHHKAEAKGGLGLGESKEASADLNSSAFESANVDVDMTQRNSAAQQPNAKPEKKGKARAGTTFQANLTSHDPFLGAAKRGAGAAYVQQSTKKDSKAGTLRAASKPVFDSRHPPPAELHL